MLHGLFKKLKYIFNFVILISAVFFLFTNYYSDIISIWFFKNSEYSFVINLLGLLIFFVISRSFGARINPEVLFFNALNTNFFISFCKNLQLIFIKNHGFQNVQTSRFSWGNENVDNF